MKRFMNPNLSDMTLPDAEQFFHDFQNCGSTVHLKRMLSAMILSHLMFGKTTISDVIKHIKNDRYGVPILLAPMYIDLLALMVERDMEVAETTIFSLHSKLQYSKTDPSEEYEYVEWKRPETLEFSQKAINSEEHIGKRLTKILDLLGYELLRDMYLFTKDRVNRGFVGD